MAASMVAGLRFCLFTGSLRKLGFKAAWKGAAAPFLF